ncbi:MAG TPA: RNA polymerase sigma-70 factor, partial [Pseudobacter sp.]|nr:RNA polymerase sigma-70 factor [Pseudobacter sp.]
MAYHPKELLIRIAEDDTKAFTHLFDQYWLQVFAHVRTYIKDAAQAEDITQDIFFSIWLNRSKLATVADFEPWLHVVTRNRTISGLRKLLREPDNELAGIIPDMPALSGDSPVMMLDYKQSQELLQKAIDQLPPRRRQVFRMSRQEGLTHQEIAEQLQISKATVNEHITEALSFLKSKM